MSVIKQYFLGPYVEHVIRREVFDNDFAERHYDVLAINWGLDLPPRVVVGIAEFLRVCYMPREKRAGQPDRPFLLNDSNSSAIVDLRAVDIDSEIDWFIRAFQAELEDLASFLGQSPTIHWGLVVTVR